MVIRTGAPTFLFSEHLIHFILFSLKRIVLVLVFVALYTLAERKVMAAMQRRTGPNVVGFFGLLQPLADGVKLVIKEIIIPSKSSKTLFILAPMVTFFLSLISWAIIPFSPVVEGNLLFENPNIELGLLLILAISSLGVYGVIIAGWASNSKYALLGALRSAAQMISYEVGIGFIIITVGLVSKSYNLAVITHLQEDTFFFFLLFPACFMFLICMLAETNRAPFDLPEAEAELVAGYNIEYSGVVFAMFFLGEYSNMLLMSALISIMFFGGWVAPLFLLGDVPSFLILFFKILFFSFFFIWARASLPRYRYDQLMYIGWKILLPLSLGFLIFVICLLKAVGLGQLLPISLFIF